jgi:uncharacterized protein YndB with AHSA1/START domain
MADDHLARFVDRYTMEYVRTYPHPIERVWRAIIDPEEFGAWFIKGRLDPRVGGRFWFGDDGFQGAVAVIEPPRLLRLADDKDDFFQYALTEVPGGTRMSFIHHIPPRAAFAAMTGDTVWDFGGDQPGGSDTPWRPGFVGGFHDMFDQLTDHLDGVPVGSRLAPTEMSTFVRKWATVSPGPELTENQREERLLVHRSQRNRERWFELIRTYRDHIKTAIPPVATTRER